MTVAVIGAGPGGIAMGIQLAAAGYDFTIFDRADGFGGTWRNNTYPGAACDVPSHFYSYSFALNPRWSKTFAQQPEILAYLERVAAEYGLEDRFVGNTRITELRWADDAQRWSLLTDDGVTHEFDAVVSAVGMLDVPNIPVIPRADRFRGRTFHSSNWDHTKSTAGERVASIGTGASAIQYVPEIAAEAAHLTVFQRTPIWVSPRYDEPFTTEQQELFERDPEEARKVRDAAFQAYEAANFGADSEMTKGLTDMAREYLARKVADPELRAKLTPSYPVGCKRPLAVACLVSDVRTPERDAGDLADRRVHRAWAAHRRRRRPRIRHRHLRNRLPRRRLPAQPRRVRNGWPTTARRLARRRRGVSGHRRSWLPEPVHAVRTQHQRRHLDHLHPRSPGRVRPSHPRSTWRRPGRGRSISSARCTTHYNAEIQQAMEGTVWLANCNNYYRHPNGKVVTQFPYSGTIFVEMLAQVELDDALRLRKEATACRESTTLR